MATDARDQKYMANENRSRLDEKDSSAWLLTWLAVLVIAILGYAAYATYQKTGDYMSNEPYSTSGSPTSGTGTDNTATR